MTDPEITTTHGERCPRCGQPLMLGRCGLCGTSPQFATAPLAAPAPTAGPPPDTRTGPAPEPGIASRPTPPPTTTPASTSTATLPPTPAPVAPSHEPDAPAVPGRSGSHPLVVAALVVGAVVVLVVGYLVVTVSGLHSDVKALRDDQKTTADRIQQLEGESSVLSSNNDELRSRLDAQAAADPAAVSSRVQPSVFTIGLPNGELGSGWVASSDGVTSKLVTNYHVIESAVRNGSNYVAVYQDKGNVLDGTVELAVQDQDLALVSVKASLPVLKQSVDQVKAGQSILVVGSPLGLGSSVSTGSVANPARDLLGVTYIQFTAPISPGNSGGAVVDLTGKVIGVTEAKLVGEGVEGLGFAIPVTNVCTFLHVCA